VGPRIEGHGCTLGCEMSRRKQAGVSVRQRVYLFLRVYDAMKANPYGGEQKIIFRVTLGGPEQGAQLLGVDQQDFESYLTRFRQLISPRDNAYIGRLLRLVPRHIDDPGLRDRLSAARQMWDVAQGVPSPIAALSLGRFAAGTETARLYFYGVGIIHSDTDMVALWDALPESKRQLVAWAFHQYEAKVRRVANDLHHILREASEGGHWRDEPLDLSA
jgi:hypothetical protein